jgi:hypothetical protein
LNEVFVAEKDIASASRYRLVPDGRDLGMFKSSGLIACTGIGSSGWLFSAKHITSTKIQAIIDKIGTQFSSGTNNNRFA